MPINQNREVTVYPYIYELEGITNDVKALSEKFSSENVQNNIKEYTQDTFLVIVLDDFSNNFIFGRFLKLRNDVPQVLNRLDGTQRTMEILDEENIVEQSHFVMNIKDGIILGEYNFEAVRHFSKPLTYYLNKLFDVKGNKIEPIPDTDTFTKLQGEEELSLFRIRVAQQNMEFLQKRFNLPTWKVLLDLAKDNETSFEIVVKKSRKRASCLNKEKAIEFSQSLRDEKIPLEVLKLETDDIVYDLLNNNLVSFKVNVKNNGRCIDSEDFFFKTRNLYDRQIDKIRLSLNKEN